MTRRRAQLTALIAPVAAMLALASCGSSVDAWAAEQAERLTQAGVTYPPEQERSTVVALAATCAWKDGTVGDGTADDLRIYVRTASMTQDWISEADAIAMWQLADEEFCASVPDGPLGG